MENRRKLHKQIVGAGLAITSIRANNVIVKTRPIPAIRNNNINIKTRPIEYALFLNNKHTKIA